jgi:CubicO group peptidase (beta-lactamase class C family)
LTLDSDVNAQLKGWKLPTPPGGHVTLRELLSHTAGTTVHGFPGYAAGVAVPSVDDVLAGRAPANTKLVVVDTKPGTIWRYSGGGYTVIQKLIGDVTGRSFADVLRDEVLHPADMTLSSFSQPLDAASLATAALPHDGSGKPVPGGPHTYPELAAAGLWTTPSDLLRYAVAVRDSARGKKNSILDQSLATAMLTPGKGGWGLGLEVHPTSADRAFAHGGSNEGYENFLVAYTGSGDGVAVMTNGAQGGELGSEITRSVAAAYGWPS